MTIWGMAQQVLSGTGATLLIFFSTIIFSLPLGLLIAWGRMSRFKPISLLVKMFISVLRGTPLMLQLIVWFYGPYYLFETQLSSGWRLTATILGFSINYAAYFAEIFRSGIQSIPLGQYEAANVLGYSKAQTFCKIIFPQMCKRVLPPVTNEVITLVKDTSLAFVLAYSEVFTLAKQVAAAQTTIIPLFIAGGFYYVFNFVVDFVMAKIEQKLNYYR